MVRRMLPGAISMKWVTLKMFFGLCVALTACMLCAQAEETKKSSNSPAKSAATTVDSKAAIPAKASASQAKSGEEYARFWPSWFQMAVTYRGRLEDTSGIGYVPDASDTYYLSRLRVEANLRVNKYLNFFAMTQDTHVYGYDSVVVRPTSMLDDFDLRQAYMDVHREIKGGKISFRLGTQYLDVGDKRLIAVSSWGNSTPVYHAAKLSFTKEWVAGDVFAATRVSTIRARNFNEPKPGENLYGAYLSLSKIVPQAKIEPFVFWRTQPLVTDENKLKADSDLATFGFRFLGKLPRRFTYTTEIAIQKGTYAQDDISAWAGMWGVGYTLSNSSSKPTISFEYNYASGDGTKGDGVRGTFDQLYASNHSNYGITDQVGWRNTINYKIGLEVGLTKKLKVQFDVNDFYLATLQDSLYTDNGSAVVKNSAATSRHIGVEPDLQLTYKANKSLTIGAGYGRLICGQFLKQSSQGESFSYPYVYWEYRY